MMEELIFYPEGHRYELDGKTIPSVTELTEALGAYAGELDAELELTLEAAAERGGALHGYMEHRLEGGLREDYELPDEWAVYADAVDLFLSEHTLSPLFVETALWAAPGGETAFAGTPDYVGDFDGRLAVLDWKFVSQVQKSKVGAQLAGYGLLCRENGVEPERAVCVQFLPDGTYRLYPAGGEGDKDFRTCLDLYRARTKKHPRGGIA